MSKDIKDDMMLKAENIQCLRAACDMRNDPLFSPWFSMSPEKLKRLKEWAMSDAEYVATQSPTGWCIKQTRGKRTP